MEILKKQNIYVIGFGASAIGFIQKCIESNLTDNYQITVFDKGKDIGKCSFGGMKYDGKLICSEDIGGDYFNLDDQRDAINFIVKNITVPSANWSTGESFGEVDDSYRLFYNKGFNLHKASYTHCGTDLLENAVENIYKHFVDSGILFEFGHKFGGIIKSGIGCHSCLNFLVSDNTGLYTKEIQIDGTGGDITVIAVGRSGAKTIRDCKYLKEHIKSSSYVDLGIRFEFPAFITEEIDKKMYEIKCSLNNSNGLMTRLFCQNPRGMVTTETYENDGEIMYTVNGHAKSNEKSDNTNLAILVRHSFTQPFNDSVAFGSAVAKLANMLGGGNKVLLQKYGDFVRGKRTKELGRVKPTLNNTSYILGDLNYALPSKTKECIIEFIEKFSEIVPGFNASDNLCYGIEVKFYSNKMRDGNNIYFVGDCSGKTSSIIKAFCHGGVLATHLLNKLYY
jgi:uncharacterized protein